MTDKHIKTATWYSKQKPNIPNSNLMFQNMIKKIKKNL